MAPSGICPTEARIHHPSSRWPPSTPAAVDRKTRREGFVAQVGVESKAATERIKMLGLVGSSEGRAIRRGKT
jgi:hypothetical protein